MQSRADEVGEILKKWSASVRPERPAFLFYGARDTTADMALAIQFFNKHNVSMEQKTYARSGHDILQDYDRDQVVADVLMTITSNP